MPLAIYWATGAFEQGYKAAQEIIELAGDDAALGDEVFEFSPLHFAKLYGSVLKSLISPGTDPVVELERATAGCFEDFDDQMKMVFFDWKSMLLGIVGDIESAQNVDLLGREIAIRIQGEDAAGTPGHQIMLLRETGQPRAAAQLGEHELSRLSKDEQNWVFVAGDVALAVLEAGDRERAIELVGEIRARLDRISLDSLPVVFVLLNTAAVLRETGAGRRKVEELLGRADSLLDRMGAVLLLPAVVEARARLATREGEENRADELFRAALRGYREKGAYGHASRLERELDT